MNDTKENKIIDPNQIKADIVIDTSSNLVDGQLKCPACGASEIQPNPKTGRLRCNYCYTEFEGKKINNITDLNSLRGRVTGSGAQNIKSDASDVVTLKCGGCGAEVVIDTKDAPHARCHWCHSILSINSKIENGAIPDVILPFSVTKEVAKNNINKFVNKRKFYANPKFKEEFTAENIMGVYFPYMLVDANCHAKFDGVGEHLIRKYTVRHGDQSYTRYDADSYAVSREFDITIDDLSVESNSKRMDKENDSLTNNIINSIMPFDTANCVQYQSNYLVGYTSERRDVNVEDLDKKALLEIQDIAKFAINPDLSFYDRGVRWEKRTVDFKGTQWIAAYLPVWLYSFQEVKGHKKVIHYVAVNARTQETMGSVPINMPLLLFVSSIIEAICLYVGFSLAYDSDEGDAWVMFFLLGCVGFVYFSIMYKRYRNKNARHKYEVETKNNISNLVRSDTKIERKRGLSSAIIEGKNNNIVDAECKKIIFKTKLK